MRAWRRGGPQARTRGACLARLEQRQWERRVVEMGPRRTKREAGQPRSQLHCEGAQPRAQTYAGVQMC